VHTRLEVKEYLVKAEEEDGGAVLDIRPYPYLYIAAYQVVYFDMLGKKGLRRGRRGG